MAVGYQGKVKTAVQMVAITMLLGVFCDGVSGDWVGKVGVLLLYISAMLSMSSALNYAKAAIKVL